ncbi:MAG: PAS domain S-box protein [Acidobacteriota bacterium]
MSAEGVKPDTQAIEAAALLSAIVDSSDDAIISKDLSGIITSWNKSAERLFGYTAEEVIGRSVKVLIPRDRLNEEPEILLRLQHGERVDHFETIRQRKDGTLFAISLTISPVKDATGKIVGASKIAHDLTDRRKSEHADQLLGAIVDSSDDAIISKDLSGIITSWNKSAERLFGYTAEEAVGKHVTLLIPPDRLQEEPEILRKLQNGERVDHFETIRQRKDGALLEISLTISPVRDASGKVVGASKIARDITERRRAEEYIRRLNQDLEQFAFSASHDLQEPLRSIKIYGELLSTRYSEKLDQQANEFLGYMCDGASRMETLVRGLLSYVHAIKSDIPADEAVDANEALQNVLEGLAGVISESGATITFDPLPDVHMDHLHLQQLFQNLIANGVKYRSPDQPPMIHISAGTQGASLLFSVKDNGIGIDPEYKERIFGVFKRLHTNDEYPGTGIGLAICQRILDRYHGRIWVESELGKGATFKFTLPR